MMKVKNNQTRTIPLPITAKFVPNEDIQFGYHSASGKQIRITNDGLGAERMDPDEEWRDGVAHGARPLKGREEFEVKIVSYGTRWMGSIQFGVMRCKKGVPIEHGPSIPRESYNAANHCVWVYQQLCNNLVTPNKKSDYGYVDLHDLHEGDHVGLRLSQDGVVEFLVNGESQGIAANNIYTRKSDVYAVVDHLSNCVATVITKAGEYYSNMSSIMADVHVPLNCWCDYSHYAYSFIGLFANYFCMNILRLLLSLNLSANLCSHIHVHTHNYKHVHSMCYTLPRASIPTPKSHTHTCTNGKGE